jgi:predicted SpoU family rRNA methylase
MRGYASLGKKLVIIHRTNQDDEELVRTVYKQYGYQKFIVRFERQWHRLMRTGQDGWHLRLQMSTEQKEGN